MWPIVRDALAGASPAVRAQIRWVAALWCGLVALQVWDSRDASGAAGVAEFLSAVLGASGVALLGAANTLQRTMDESTSRRRPGGDAAAVQQVLIALPALGFAAGAALGAAAAMMALRTLLGAEPLLTVIGLAVYGGMLLLAGHTVMSSARTLFRHATHQAAAAAEARGQAAASQLAALQARLNPHVLFNALNTVASLIRSSPPAAERAVENLSDVLRQTLQRSSATLGTVQEEIDYVRACLTLEEDRWGSRLRVEWDVDEAARACPLPPLVLQPLVENALAHGIGSRLTGGTLRITVRGGERLTLRVNDDGPGFPYRWKEGTGLGNLRERLRVIFGDAATLEVREAVKDAKSDAAGAEVSVTLPNTAAPQV
jgi:signal transduction histidine kinase